MNQQSGMYPGILYMFTDHEHVSSAPSFLFCRPSKSTDCQERTSTGYILFGIVT